MSCQVFQHHGRRLRSWMSFGGIKVFDPHLMFAMSADQNNTLSRLSSNAIHGLTLRELSAKRVCLISHTGYFGGLWCREHPAPLMTTHKADVRRL